MRSMTVRSPNEAREKLASSLQAIAADVEQEADALSHEPRECGSLMAAAENLVQRLRKICGSRVAMDDDVVMRKSTDISKGTRIVGSLYVPLGRIVEVRGEPPIAIQFNRAPEWLDQIERDIQRVRDSLSSTIGPIEVLDADGYAYPLKHPLTAEALQAVADTIQDATHGRVYPRLCLPDPGPR